MSEIFEALAGLHPAVLAAAIFLLRIVDVSMGTLRTITVVQGRTKISVVLGFLEVLIWITAVSQVIASVKDNPVVILGWAGGFATGNAVGIWLEKRLAMGSVVVSMISSANAEHIASSLRGMGRRLTTFPGQGRDGPVTMIYAIVPRRDLPAVLQTAKGMDPDVFWVVETLREWSTNMPHALPHPTGWRAVFKKK